MVGGAARNKPTATHGTDATEYFLDGNGDNGANVPTTTITGTEDGDNVDDDPAENERNGENDISDLEKDRKRVSFAKGSGQTASTTLSKDLISMTAQQKRDSRKGRTRRKRHHHQIASKSQGSWGLPWNNVQALLEIPMEYTFGTSSSSAQATSRGERTTTNASETAEIGTSSSTVGINDNSSRRTNAIATTGLVRLPQSRLVTTATFPIYSAASTTKTATTAVSNSQPFPATPLVKKSSPQGEETSLLVVSCKVSVASGQRGRTGYSTGSVDINGTTTTTTQQHQQRSTTRTTDEHTTNCRITTITTGLGGIQPPKLRGTRKELAPCTTESDNELVPQSDNILESDASSCYGMGSSSSTLRFGACTTNVHQKRSRLTPSLSSSSSTSFGANFNVPMSNDNNLLVPVGERASSLPSLLSLSASRQHPLLVPFLWNGKNTTDVNPSLSQKRLMMIQSQILTCLKLAPQPNSTLLLHSCSATVSCSSTDSGSLASRQKPLLHSVAATALANWKLQFGLHLSPMEKIIRPLVGCMVNIKLPVINWLNREMSDSDREPQRQKLLDFSVQWKGNAWQMGGVWTLSPKLPHTESAHGVMTKGGNQFSSNTSNTHGSDSGQRIQQPQRRHRRRQVGIGVSMQNTIRNTSSNGRRGPSGILSWIFTWTEGDFTMRIPILWKSSISATSIYYHQVFQFFYLSFLSILIHDVVGSALSLPLEREGKDPKRLHQDRVDLYTKARADALLQQRYMKRPAQSQMATELERNGLVIRSAIYYLPRRHNRDSGTSSSSASEVERGNWESDEWDAESSYATAAHEWFDVTIPLQFWVSPTGSSTLELYGATNRGHLLGFYDIAKAFSKKSLASTEEQPQKPTKDDKAVSPATPQGILAWFQQLVSIMKRNGEDDATSGPGNDLDAPVVTTVRPELYIRYDYGGLPYDITVRDNETVTLPSELARLRQG